MKLTGTVKSNSMDKTVVVEVESRRSHNKYKKVYVNRKKFYAHTEDEIEIGETVVIEERLPISKTKRWAVVELPDRKDKSKK